MTLMPLSTLLICAFAYSKRNTGAISKAPGTDKLRIVNPRVHGFNCNDK